jgi:hypothetical protein
MVPVMLAPRFQIKRRHHLGQSQNQLVCLSKWWSLGRHPPPLHLATEYIQGLVGLQTYYRLTTPYC